MQAPLFHLSFTLLIITIIASISNNFGVNGQKKLSGEGALLADRFSPKVVVDAGLFVCFFINRYQEKEKITNL